MYSKWHEAQKQEALKRAAQIAKLVKKGETVQEVAESLGITRQRVYQIVARASGSG